MPKEVIIETTDNQRIGASYNWLSIALTGAAIGLVVWLLGWALERYIVDPLLCREAISQACGDSASIAGNVAAVIGAIGGVAALIRSGVRRSVAVALAVLASLWGLSALYGDLRWFEGLLWAVGLYSLGYVLFVYLSRIRHIVVAIVAMVLLVLMYRWVAFL